MTGPLNSGKQEAKANRRDLNKRAEALAAKVQQANALSSGARLKTPQGYATVSEIMANDSCRVEYDSVLDKSKKQSQKRKLQQRLR